MCFHSLTERESVTLDRLIIVINHPSSQRKGGSLRVCPLCRFHQCIKDAQSRRTFRSHGRAVPISLNFQYTVPHLSQPATPTFMTFSNTPPPLVESLASTSAKLVTPPPINSGSFASHGKAKDRRRKTTQNL